MYSHIFYGAKNEINNYSLSIYDKSYTYYQRTIWVFITAFYVNMPAMSN